MNGTINSKAASASSNTVYCRLWCPATPPSHFGLQIKLLILGGGILHIKIPFQTHSGLILTQIEVTTMAFWQDEGYSSLASSHAVYSGLPAPPKGKRTLFPKSSHGDYFWIPSSCRRREICLFQPLSVRFFWKDWTGSSHWWDPMPSWDLNFTLS